MSDFIQEVFIRGVISLYCVVSCVCVMLGVQQYKDSKYASCGVWLGVAMVWLIDLFVYHIPRLK